MKVLGIDTSTMRASVGIIDDGEVVAEYMLSGSRYHSESLTDMIDEIFRKLDFKIEDIDLLAVGIGPGSFTGVRIAVTMMKIYAQFLEKDICGVSSLAAMAVGTNSDRIIVPITDAKRHRAYSGIYKEIDGKIVALREDDLKDVSEIIEELKSMNEKVLLTGPGREVFIEEFKESLDVKMAYDMNLTGSHIAKMGIQKYEEEGTDNYFEVLPNYIRLSQAESQMKEKNAKKSQNK